MLQLTNIFLLLADTRPHLHTANLLWRGLEDRLCHDDSKLGLPRESSQVKNQVSQSTGSENAAYLITNLLSSHFEFRG